MVSQVCLRPFRQSNRFRPSTFDKVDHQIDRTIFATAICEFDPMVIAAVIVPVPRDEALTVEDPIGIPLRMIL